ncbi:MAG: PEP-CTERM sorting domain-containing protein [Rhodothalassiaceae bacterium]
MAAYDRGNASFEPNDFIEVALNDSALLTLNGINRRGAGFTDAAGTTALPADGLFRSFQFDVGDLLLPGDNLLSFSIFNTTTNEFVGLDDVALTAQPSFGVQGTDFAVVPVPGSLALMGLGVAAVGARLRRHG